MGHAYDPELAPLIPALPPIDATDVRAARDTLRAMYAAMPQPAEQGVRVEDRRIPGATGGTVGVRLYRPVEPVADAAVLDVHGGGFLMGGLETDHARNVVLARELGVLVVSVDYRLAPEVRYPGALEDVLRALEWVAAHADELRVDAGRIALHGDSAGGGLCAAAALAARDRGGPSIAFQFLGYPMLDDRLATPSARRFTDTPNWDRRNAAAGWDAYLGAGVPGTAAVPAHAAPARADDLTGLPPAYVSAMHFDPLRDEGVAYGLALLAADVPVEIHVFPGTFHGSSLLDAAVSRRQLEEEVAVLRHALALPRAGDAGRGTTPVRPPGGTDG